MIVRIGQPVLLSLALKRNDRLYPGQIVTVDVVGARSGSVYVSEEPVPETATPGIYSIFWNSPPTIAIDLVAIFRVKNRIFTEAIQIVSADKELASGISAGATVSGSLQAEPLEGGIEVGVDIDPEIRVKTSVLKFSSNVAHDLQATGSAVEIAVPGPVC